MSPPLVTSRGQLAATSHVGALLRRALQLGRLWFCMPRRETTLLAVRMLWGRAQGPAPRAIVWRVQGSFSTSRLVCACRGCGSAEARQVMSRGRSRHIKGDVCGVPGQAILDFCREIGITRSDGEAHLHLLEHHIRSDLDAHSPRALAVLRPLRLVLTNLPADHFEEFPAKVRGRRLAAETTGIWQI